MTRACKVCGQTLPLEAFGVISTTPTKVYRRHVCKACQQARRRGRGTPLDTVPARVCKVCGQELPLSAFGVALTTPTKMYRRRVCKACQQARWQERGAELDTQPTRVCRKCGRELPCDAFELVHGYRRRVCRACAYFQRAEREDGWSTRQKVRRRNRQRDKMRRWREQHRAAWNAMHRRYRRRRALEKWQLGKGR